ncbi:hypothetical protein [Streptomyces sp. NBC_00328]|uniref:hypothetical protein n=1 Tax=Streptomyces sp. NBC_00328 TaxID=2903646 RepID=UPI002E28696C|nr:hypothetical protein [Streptomyces sp. NBC_00328]
MRTSPGLPLRRAIVGGSALAAWAPGGPASAEPPADRPPAARAQTLPFTQRYHALQHGGVVRTVNSSICCRSSAGTLGSGEERVVRLDRIELPGHVRGRGPVAYNGDRGGGGGSLSVSTGRGTPTSPGDLADPRDDVPNSTIGGPGPGAPRRVPSYANTLGCDSEILELGEGIRGGGDQLAFRIVSQRDAAWIGALFAAVDAKQ